MNPSLKIPGKLKEWAGRWEKIAQLLDSPYGDELLKAYESLDVDALYVSITHGQLHIERTMLFGALIAMNEGLTREETNDLLLCCSYHDIGRVEDHYNEIHGAASAEIIAAGEKKNSFFHLQESLAAVCCHAMPDAQMDTVPARYGVQDLELFHKLAACLKDADNLDRVRIYDLDTSFLRHQSTVDMEELAWWVLDKSVRVPAVLCYGDSNTYGYNPRTGGRYPEYMRWPNVLQSLLGENWRVIPEGLNGRTTAFDRESGVWKNGLYSITPVLSGNIPLDVVVFLLGTNDCAAELDLTAAEVAQGMKRLLGTAKQFLLENQGYLPRIILVAPPHIEPTVFNGPFREEMNEKSLQTSAELPEQYRLLAQEEGCEFVNIDGKYAFSALDSEHFRPFDGKRVAALIADRILERDTSNREQK